MSGSVNDKALQAPSIANLFSQTQPTKENSNSSHLSHFPKIVVAKEV